MGDLRGKSFFVIPNGHANLKCKSGQDFWAKGYTLCQSSWAECGNKRKYIRISEQAEIMKYKKNMKALARGSLEYVRPYSRGGKRLGYWSEVYPQNSDNDLSLPQGGN